MSKVFIKSITLIVFSSLLNSCIHSKEPKEFINDAIKEIKLKNYNAAYDYLCKAIVLDSNCGEAYYIRGQVIDLQCKEKDLVCKDLKKAVDLGYKEAINGYKSYCTTMPKDEYEPLKMEFDEYISKHPERFEGYSDRADLYFDYGLYENAIEDYTKVLSITEYPVAYYNRGLCYSKLRMKEKCCQDIKKAAELGYIEAIKALPLCN